MLAVIVKAAIGTAGDFQEAQTCNNPTTTQKKSRTMAGALTRDRRHRRGRSAME